MSPKRLLPLIGIVLVLALLAVLLKRQPPATRLADEVGLVRLAPDSFKVEAVSGVDVFLGAQPQAVVQLRKRDGNWWVPSHFEAPGNSPKIQQLLTQISTLQGELRADAAPLLEDFRLKDEQALHLKFYLDNTTSSALYLLAGKSSGSNGFMRRSGENNVYAVNLNAQMLAGVSSSTPEQPLDAKPWLDLRLQNVPREQITTVELQAPTRVLRFTTTAPAEAGQTAPPSWTLHTPQLPYPVKSDAVESLVTTLRTLQADEIVDPENTAAYGLEAPSYRAILTLQAGGQEAVQRTLLIGAEAPEKSGSRYARLSTGGPVYLLPQWTWKRLVPILGTVLDLRLFQISADEVMQVAFQQDGATWQVTRDSAATDSTWHVVGATEAALDETALHSLLGTITQLSAEDLPATLPVSTGLEQPALQITLTLRDGRTVSLHLGQAIAPEGGGYYASRADASEVLIISASLQRTLSDTVTKLKPGAAASEKGSASP